MRSTSKYASSDGIGHAIDDGSPAIADGDVAPFAGLIDVEVTACRLLAFRDDCSDSEMLQDCHRRLLTRGTVSWSDADRIVSAIAQRLECVMPSWTGSR